MKGSEIMGKADLDKRQLDKFIKENELVHLRTKGSHKRYLIPKSGEKITLKVPMNKMQLQEYSKKYGLKMNRGD